jgi:hypothetical protein
MLDGRLLAKFAFSEPTAVRVWHEARVLELLAGQPGFDVPKLVAASPNPAFLVTRLVERGVPLSYELVRAAMPEGVDAVGGELAGFLAGLHAPEILRLASARLGQPLRAPEPGLQATTDELRRRFTPMIDSQQRERVQRWCDWADAQLSAPTEVVFVHGDFHSYNQLWEARRFRLLIVADFETSGAAEPEYDFRCIPSFGPGVDLLTSAVRKYTQLTGRRLSVQRIMALHLCTTLSTRCGAPKPAFPCCSRVPAEARPVTTSTSWPRASRFWASNSEARVSRPKTRVRVGAGMPSERRSMSVSPFAPEGGLLGSAEPRSDPLGRPTRCRQGYKR